MKVFFAIFTCTLLLVTTLEAKPSEEAVDPDEDADGTPSPEEDSPSSKEKVSIDWKDEGLKVEEDNWEEVLEERNITLPEDPDQPEMDFGDAIIWGVNLITDKLTSIFGVFNIVKLGFNTVLAIFEGVESIVKYFGFDLKHDVLFFDIRCTDCKIAMKCYSTFKSHDWNVVDPEFGALLKFSNRIPHDWNTFLIFGWKCFIRDDGVKGRMVNVDVFGGKAPKYAENLIVIKDDRIISIDIQTKRVDLSFSPVYW